MFLILNLKLLPEFLAVYLLPAAVIHNVAVTDLCSLYLSLSQSPPLLSLPVRKEWEDFWHSSVKIFTQLLSAEMCERRRTKDEEG